jgi:thiosulfate/3-mercaptopyruvate sulfurtransferase
VWLVYVSLHNRISNAIHFHGKQKHLHDTNVKLIDGRPADQFSGEQPGTVFHTGKEHKHRGHIPGAVNVFWKDNFNPDGTFKSKQELKKLYANAGVAADQCVVTYCNEGLHAAPPWFVLTEILGYDDVRVYDDSMSEWGNSDQPTETSAATNRATDK